MTYTVSAGSKSYEINVGLEIHCEITSNAKLFSQSPAHFGGSPNSHVSFFDAGFPGMLPQLNEFCISQAIKTGLGLNATINKTSIFARKHYFYADLPAGYQISQHTNPLVSDGSVEIELEDGTPKTIRVERLHVEQDAGKLVHDRSPSKSLVDLNRAGVGLMEIVSRPDMTSPHEVGEYIRAIRTLVRYLGTCDGNMDEGSMRCDVNLSIHEAGSKEMGTRTETKNVNSVKFAMQAVMFEANRQAEILAKGGKIDQETRLFDPSTGTTRAMRSKENSFDYRYFPDPDILPLVLTEDQISKIKAEMPELPRAKRARLVVEYGLTPDASAQLAADRETADFFEETSRISKNGKASANWILGDLFAYLNAEGLTVANSPIRPKHLSELIALIDSGIISGKMAKDVFAEMVAGPERSALAITDAKGLKQIQDPAEITAAIDRVITGATDNVEKYRAGKVQLIGWFVGQVIKETGGRANPDIVNKLLREKLG